MTNAELDTKIAEHMEALKADGVVDAIKKAWKDYSANLKEIARKGKKKGEKLAHAIDRLSDTHPCEQYCYIMFDEDGEGRGWTIEHNQYWQGNSGPTACIPLSPDTTYKDIEREIGEELSQALDIED